MKYPLTFPSIPSSKGFRRRRKGFTLIEMMTALTVLSLMMVMLGQILQMVGMAWTNGEKNVNNFTKARAMLDMFSKDIQSGVFRNDLAAFPLAGATTSASFYTQRPGVPSTNDPERYVSLVQYDYNPDQSTSINMTTLQRGDMAISWDASPTVLPFGNTTDFNGDTVTPRNTAPGVVDYKLLFVYANGTVSTTYTYSTTNPLRAVGLTLLVVDDQTLKLLTTSEVTALRTAFDLPAVTTGTRSVKADWENYLATGMSWSSYPKSLGVGLKVFERYVPVTGF
jgi:prepilin-type N-terminal cleavage/methylation domain-containing protein